MRAEPCSLPDHELHSFFSTLITPRLIAFISTVDEKGRFNAAPFSTFMHLTLIPPVPAVGIGRGKGQKKDTARNIETIGDFVVNMVDEDLAHAMNQATADYPPGMDEIKETGLTAVKSDKVSAPRIVEAPISLECKLTQIIEFGGSPERNSIVFAEILIAHIRDEILTKGKIDARKARIIGRLGDGDLYCRTTDIFQLKRPQSF